MHVVPVALYAWLRHTGNFRTALISVLNVAVTPTTTSEREGSNGVTSDSTTSPFLAVPTRSSLKTESTRFSSTKIYPPMTVGELATLAPEVIA